MSSDIVMKSELQSSFTKETAIEALGNLSDGLMNYKLIAAGSPVIHANELDIEKVKSQFSRLKFNFQELSTKEAFIDGLKHILDTDRTERVIAMLEPVTADGKAEVKRLKAENAKLAEEIREAIETISMEDEAFVRARDNLQVKLSNLSDKDSATLESVLGEIATREGELDAQVREIRALNEQAVAASERIAELEWELEPVQRTVERLRKTIETQREAIEALKVKPTSREDEKQLEDTLAALSSINDLTQGLAGVSVTEFHAGSAAVVRVQLFSGASTESDAVTFELKYHSGTQVLKTVTVVSAPSAFKPESYGDILAQAVKRNSFSFLVHETRSRFTSIQQTRMSLSSLSSELRDVIFNQRGDHQVVFSVKKLSTLVSFFAEFQSNGNFPIIVKIENDLSGMFPIDINLINDRIERENMDIVNTVRFIKSTFF